MQKDIEMFIDNIRKYDDLQTFSEADTRNVIINKLLSILGWDTYNRNEVSQEHDVHNKRVDYSLKIEKDDKVFIEAKRSRECLTEIHEGQLLTYSLTKDIELAILTNGIHWRFYLPLEGGGLKKKRFYEADILQQDPIVIASKFIDLLSKNNVINRKAFNNAITIYKNKIKIIETDHIVRQAKVKNIHIKDSSPIEYGSLSDYDPVDKKISSFYFMNSRYPVDTWKGLLIGIIDIMYSVHAEEFDKILNVTGRSRIYFSYSSNELSTPIKIKDTDMYVETKLGAKIILKLCVDILYEFGYPITYFAIEILENGIIGNIASTKPVKIVKPEHISIPVTVISESGIKVKKKGERYGKYKTAIVPIIPWIKKQINSNNDGIARVKISDMTKVMGSEFEKKSNTSIYWGLKYTLFEYDVIVDMCTHDGDKLLVMRTRANDDELPPSLAQHLEDKEYDPGEETDCITGKYNIKSETNTSDEQKGTGSKKELIIDIIHTDMNKMFCKNCGKGMQIDEKFCKYCGHKYSEQKLDKMLCENCGKGMQIDEKFCRYCGHKHPEQKSNEIKKGSYMQRASKQIVEKKLFCQNCKKEILTKDTNYCKYCGYRLEKYEDVI
jgi:predicted type IV restriction endonuclease/RNA polymerase subunit RPABC4/transcription elongation factor Spt4